MKLASWLVLLPTACGCCLIAAATTRMSEPKIITASQFQVVDESGKVRGTFGRNDISTSLNIDNPAGKGDCDISVSDSGIVGVRMSSNGGSLGLGVSVDGLANLTLSGRKSRIAMTAAPDGSARLELKDDVGRLRVAIVLTAEGNTVLHTFDDAEQLVWRAGNAPTP